MINSDYLLLRITPKKNLKYCIEILSRVSVKFKMDIYGPIDDDIYWEDCKKLINKFDLINKIEYCGIIKRSRIIQTLTNYDLFIL